MHLCTFAHFLAETLSHAMMISFAKHFLTFAILTGAFILRTLTQGRKFGDIA